MTGQAGSGGPEGSVPEFSRTVTVAQLLKGPLETTLSPTAEERASLARRLDVPEVREMDGRLHVAAAGGGQSVKVDGHLTAAVDRECVVTLETFIETIDEDFSVLFEAVVDEASNAGLTRAGVALEIDIDPEEEIDTEPFDGRAIDLGEVLTQQLGLALSPHPRKPGADEADGIAERIGDGDTVVDVREPRTSPFAVLQGRLGGTDQD